MSEPVFLPLMREDQPDTAERVRLEVQRIPFALPPKEGEAGIVFKEDRVRKLKYAGAPVLFRFEREGP